MFQQPASFYRYLGDIISPLCVLSGILGNQLLPLFCYKLFLFYIPSPPVYLLALRMASFLLVFPVCSSPLPAIHSRMFHRLLATIITFFRARTAPHQLIPFAVALIFSSFCSPTHLHPVS